MVKIITDTLSCLPKDFSKAHGIPMIPQIINFGNNSYTEGINIDIPTFYHLLTSGENSPSTAAPPPIYYAEEYEKLVGRSEDILVVCPSDKLSGTGNSARVAAKDFPDLRIKVFSTQTIGTGQSSMVQIAEDMATQGKNIEEIEKFLIHLRDRSKTYFVVDTLDYLAKGGRIGGASYLIGSMLQIKPILEIQDGQVESKEKARTKKRAVATLKELVLQNCAKKSSPSICMMHANALDEITLLADDFKKELGIEDIYITDVPPAITTHAGPGVMAISFFTD
ncbi:MAG: DegV family protein [Anaerolineales bacterium]|nr:DegV family protein [Anaerolineales bacterium]